MKITLPTLFTEPSPVNSTYYKQSCLNPLYLYSKILSEIIILTFKDVIGNAILTDILTYKTHSVHKTYMPQKYIGRNMENQKEEIVPVVSF